MNWYDYAHDDPVNEADPAGTCAINDNEAACPPIVVPESCEGSKCNIKIPELKGVTINGKRGDAESYAPPDQQPSHPSQLLAGLSEGPMMLAANNGGNRGRGGRPDRDDPWLDRESEKDYAKCRSLSSKQARAKCWSSAADRDAARRSGRPIPPLVTAAVVTVGVGVALYWIISEGSRAFLPRNLVPIP